MNAKDAVNRRHEVRLQWLEPWPGVDVEGKEVTAHILLQATVHDCINLQRAALRGRKNTVIISDEDLLINFVVANHAFIIDPERVTTKDR